MSVGEPVVAQPKAAVLLDEIAVAVHENVERLRIYEQGILVENAHGKNDRMVR